MANEIFLTQMQFSQFVTREGALVGLILSNLRINVTVWGLWQVDITQYRVKEHHPLLLEEVQACACAQSGGIFVNEARIILVL
jgi:hypothetical protein